MRTPIKSESEALLFTMASAAVIGVAVLFGILVKPLVGGAVFAAVMAAAMVAYLRAGEPDHTPLRDAAAAPHPHGASEGQRHVLVVANAALSGPELELQIAGSNQKPVEIDVLAPVLTSHLHYGMSDFDREYQAAQVRLERSLTWAREHGIAARGEVGDTNPTTGIEDELRDFGADEVIVVTPRDRILWQERIELARLRDELDIPVTQIVVEDDEAASPSGPAR